MRGQNFDVKKGKNNRKRNTSALSYTGMKPNFNPKLLALGGGILLLGSAFVIASLYLPPNLTLKFMESMQALSPTFFYMVLASGIVGVGVGAGALYLAKKGTKKSIKFNLVTNDHELEKSVENGTGNIGLDVEHRRSLQTQKRKLQEDSMPLSTIDKFGDVEDLLADSSDIQLSGLRVEERVDSSVEQPSGLRVEERVDSSVEQPSGLRVEEHVDSSVEQPSGLRVVERVDSSDEQPSGLRVEKHVGLSDTRPPVSNREQHMSVERSRSFLVSPSLPSFSLSTIDMSASFQAVASRVKGLSFFATNGNGQPQGQSSSVSQVLADGDDEVTINLN